MSNQSSTLRASIVVFTSALFFFYAFLQLNVYNPLVPYLLQTFKLTALELGNLSAYYFYGNLLFIFLGGIILDRVSTRKVILTFMTLLVVATFLFATAHHIFLATISRFITGICGAFCFLSSFRLACRWFPPKGLALVVGLIVTIAMLGGTVAQTPMTLLIEAFGWRHALIIDGFLGLIILIVIFLVVHDYPPGSEHMIQQHKNTLEQLGFWQSLKKTILNIQNWLAGIYTSLLNLPIFLLGAIWGNLYLEQIHHLTPSEASFITSMLFIGTIVGSPVLGWFSDSINLRKLPMILFAILSLITMLLIIYLPKLSVPLGMFLFFLLGFTTSAQIISYPLIAESNSPALTGTASGLASTLIMAGGLSQPFFGWLIELNWDKHVVNGVPQYGLHNFQTALLIMAVAMIIGLMAACFLKETHCRSQVL